MKKTLLLFTALLCTIAFTGWGQTITIKNMTSCNFNSYLYGHDATYTGCNGLNSVYVGILSGTTTVYNVADFNNSSCGGTYSGTGWGAGCATNGPGAGWDGIFIGGCNCAGPIDYDRCHPPVPTTPISVPDCIPGTYLNLDWTPDPMGNVVVRIYN